MSPQEKTEFKRLQEQVRMIEQATNPAFVAALSRVIKPFVVELEDGASTSGTVQAVRNAADTGSEDVADTFNGVLRITDQKGNTYRIGYYS